MNTLAFIGGGNMAGAIIGGLVRSGQARAILVVEPGAERRAQLQSEFGVTALAAADATLADADTVVWAVKPQSFAEAAVPCKAFIGLALQVSVMAGIRSDTIARASGSERVVRTMPNTPALIGQGIAGVYARAAVTAADRAAVDTILAPTGRSLWVDAEVDLDAVTAVSGSGPAYVFYVIEALADAAVAMGLSPAQGRALALATFSGATALAEASSESPAILRERVTSKGGTTYAALSVLEAAGVKDSFLQALKAAQKRAGELGDEFGG